jgi:phage shock protein E
VNQLCKKKIMTLKEMIASRQSTIIDVRNPGELAEGVFPGAINIPVNEIPARAEEIGKMKAPLILYCRSGNRSQMAIMMVQAAGVNSEMYNGGGYSDMLQLLN